MILGLVAFCWFRVVDLGFAVGLLLFVEPVLMVCCRLVLFWAVCGVMCFAFAGSWLVGMTWNFGIVVWVDFVVVCSGIRVCCFVVI